MMLELVMLSPLDGLRWYIGTMGFSYADWSGVFYPADMPARNYLSYYSRIFNGVEIDSTFYGIPRETTIRRWASIVGPAFKFCLKTPRAITHDSGLKDVEAEMRAFLDQVVLLGEALGVVLLQFPPSFRRDQLGALEGLLTGLPEGYKFAVEIRDPSWFDIPSGQREPALASLLRSLGICWAATEYPGLPARFYRTTDWLYIRWIGQHGAYRVHDHERVDKVVQLRDWCAQIARESDRMAEIYGFLNNDYAGFAVGTADRLKGILELPRQEYRPPKQATMF
jgi:uncharacterized protein YecE (DUF72 family)